MNGKEVIEDGTIVVRDNLIESVGSSANISIPRECQRS